MHLRPRRGEPVDRVLAPDLAVQQISELLRVDGADFVGPFPTELQNFTTFTAGVSTNAKELEAATALLRYLAGPAARAVIRAKGMEPG